MRVVLKNNNSLKPRIDMFEKALLGMRVPPERLAQMTIMVDFRDMIRDGTMQTINENEFIICLRVLRIKWTLSETVAHELKHIAIEVLSPKRFRKDGKKRGPYKWEEVNCNRAEKRWGKLEYFETAE